MNRISRKGLLLTIASPTTMSVVPTSAFRCVAQLRGATP